MDTALDSEAIVGTAYRTHNGSLQRYLTSLTRDPSTAEDLTQEVFVQVFKAISTFRGDGKLKFYFLSRENDSPSQWSQARPLSSAVDTPIICVFANIAAPGRDRRADPPTGGVSLQEIRRAPATLGPT